MVCGLNTIQMMRDQALEARGIYNAALQLIIDFIEGLAALPSVGFALFMNTELGLVA